MTRDVTGTKVRMKGVLRAPYSGLMWGSALTEPPAHHEQEPPPSTNMTLSPGYIRMGLYATQSEWLHDVTKDGDVERNPGPTEDPALAALQGAPFMAAHAGEPYVRLAQGGKGKGKGARPKAPPQREPGQLGECSRAGEDMEVDVQVHDCPFEASCDFVASTRDTLLTHVDRIHVSRGHVPPRAWLIAMDRKVCAACLKMQRRGERCVCPRCLEAP